MFYKLQMFTINRLEHTRKRDKIICRIVESLCPGLESSVQEKCVSVQPGEEKTVR